MYSFERHLPMRQKSTKRALVRQNLNNILISVTGVPFYILFN
jgi:hypothetical protein